MSIKSLLFPPENRGFSGKRWLMILLRTLHLIGLSGIGASFLFNLQTSDAEPFLYLTIASGVLMMLLEIWGNGVWLLQIKGIAIIIKLLLIAGMVIWPTHGALLFTLTVIISAVSSHAPGYVRYYSPWHRRRI